MRTLAAIPFGVADVGASKKTPIPHLLGCPVQGVPEGREIGTPPVTEPEGLFHLIFLHFLLLSLRPPE